jgi:hypothetical protein
MTGFMFVARRILLHQYDVALRSASGSACSSVLVPGRLWRPVQWYPYDFVTLFVFSPQCSRSWPGAFGSCPCFSSRPCQGNRGRLVVGYLLLENRAPALSEGHAGWLLGAATSACSSSTARAFRWPSPGLLVPGRNTDYSESNLAFGSWTWLFVLVAVAQMVAMRARWPRDLRRLMWLLPILLVPASSKEWIEEAASVPRAVRRGRAAGAPVARFRHRGVAFSVPEAASSG